MKYRDLINNHLRNAPSKKNAVYILKVIFKWKTAYVTKLLQITEGTMWGYIANVNNELLELYGDPYDEDES